MSLDDNNINMIAFHRIHRYMLLNCSICHSSF